MKTLKLSFVAVAAALTLVACGDTQTANRQPANAGPAANATQPPAATPTPTPDEMAQARADYGNFCIRCHKEDGTGGKFELDEGGTINVPSLREHGLKDSDQELADHIRNGGKKMPAFKDRLSGERIDALVKLIRADFHGRKAGGAATAGAAGNANAGAAGNANGAGGAPSPAR